MLKLKLQYFGHLMWRVDSLEKTLILGGIGGRRRRRQQRMRWLDGITDSVGHEFEWTLGVCDGQGGLACCSPWGHKESDTTEWLNWTELSRPNSQACRKSIFLFSKRFQKFRFREKLENLLWPQGLISQHSFYQSFSFSTHRNPKPFICFLFQNCFTI